MRKVDAVLLVEHVSRELDVACAIKHHAQRDHGLELEVVSVYRLQEAQAQLQPRVVLLPFCYSARNAVPLWRQAIYFNLGWEQLLYPAFQVEKSPSDAFSRVHVVHHAWGDFHRQFLIQCGVPEEHIWVNGQPSYKLYDEPYCRYYARRVDLAREFGLDASKPWLFFPENYGWGFYTEERLKEIIDRGLDAAIAHELRDYCRESFAVVMRWCADLAAAGDLEVVVRPRPMTSLERFAEQVEQSVGARPPSFHLIKQGSVREWTMAADVVLSSYSTTLIEAAIAGKAAYMVEPIPLPKQLEMEWHRLVTHLRTWEEFREACRDAGSSDATDGLRTWARREMMGNGDAVANIARFTRGLRDATIPAPPPAPDEALRLSQPSTAKTSPFRRAARSLRQQVDRLHGKRGKYYLDDTQRAKIDAYFDDAEVEARLGRWSQVLS